MEAPAKGLARAAVEGIAFAVVAGLITAVVGSLLTAQVLREARAPTCADPRDLRALTPTGAHASSTLPSAKAKDGRILRYDAGRAVDGDTGTSWVEGTPGLGTGQWIEFTFDRAVRPRLLCVVNGYALTWDLYQANARVRGIHVTRSDDDRGTAAVLADAGEPDRVATFQDVRLRGGDPSTTLRLTVTSLYAASGRKRYADTALSEIEFWG